MEIQLQVVEGLQKLLLRRSQLCRSLVWSFESELGNGDTLRLQILPGPIVVYVVRLAAQFLSKYQPGFNVCRFMFSSLC